MGYAIVSESVTWLGLLGITAVAVIWWNTVRGIQRCVRDAEREAEKHRVP